MYLPQFSDIVELFSHVGYRCHCTFVVHFRFLLTLPCEQVLQMVNDVAFSIERELNQLTEQMQYPMRECLGYLDSIMRHSTPYSLRDDSRLAYKFATGEVRNMRAFDVAHEMACMQYLCEHMPYQQDLPDHMKKLAKHLKQKTNASWKRVWNTTSDLGAELIKLELMMRSEVTIPDFQGPIDQATIP